MIQTQSIKHVGKRISTITHSNASSQSVKIAQAPRSVDAAVFALGIELSHNRHRDDSACRDIRIQSERLDESHDNILAHCVLRVLDLRSQMTVAVLKTQIVPFLPRFLRFDVGASVCHHQQLGIGQLDPVVQHPLDVDWQQLRRKFQSGTPIRDWFRRPPLVVLSPNDPFALVNKAIAAIFSK